MIGVNTALETLVSNAYGRGNLRDCGTYLHRSIFVITLLSVPIMLLVHYTPTLLMLIGSDPQVVEQTQLYLDA